MGSRGPLVSLALVMLAAAALVPAAPSASEGAQGGKQKNWMTSGKRYSLAALEGTRARALPGRFAALCSARDVRALAVLNDTLWIGTEGGLFAWRLGDASAVAAPVIFPISVRALGVDDARSLWVGGDHRLAVRSPLRWRVFAEESLPFFGRIRCISAGETKLWIGTYGNGCGYVRGEALAVLTAQDSLLDERVLSIVEETPDFIDLGTASGLITADSLGWKSLRYGSRLPIGAVNDMALDEDGTLYLAIAEQGVSLMNIGRIRTFGGAGEAPGADVRALGLDPTGRVWAAGDAGVFVFDGSTWAPCPAPGLAALKCRYRSIRHDEDGLCYLGTDDGRVIVVSRDSVRTIAVPQAFAESLIPRIHAAGGAMWLIGGRNVYSYRGTFAKIAPPPELYAGELTDIAPGENGELWATSRFGILHFNGRTWEVFDRRTGLGADHFTRVARDAAGTLWFVPFDGGMVSFAGGTWSTYGHADGLPADGADDLALDPAGRPWIVTGHGDVAHWVQGTWARMELPRPRVAKAEAAGAADSLPRFDPAIRFLPEVGRGGEAAGGAGEHCIGFDKAGSCLVGTPTCVYRLATTGWQTLELPAGLRGARPTAVLGTSRGEIWLGTAGSGIYVNRGGGEWVRIGASTGLTDDYVRSLCEDQKGGIWIGTQFGGLTRYAPPEGE
jgi:ligand-binding sensor domain-containing protein